MSKSHHPERFINLDLLLASAVLSISLFMHCSGVSLFLFSKGSQQSPAGYTYSNGRQKKHPKFASWWRKVCFMVQTREDNGWTKLVLIPTNSFWCFLGNLDSCLSLQVILWQGGSKLNFQMLSFTLPPRSLHSWLSLSSCPFWGILEGNGDHY